MPVIESTYKVSDYFLAGDLQTILPALFRKVGNVFYKRERIITPDNDFLDLDWSVIGSKKIAILNHGLEGNSSTPYMLGMTKALNENDYDVLAWNYRSCSEEVNKQYRFYHSGETADLAYIINLVIEKKCYDEIVLIGFSVGGNITLKFIGEQGQNLHPLIKKAVVFSVPCDLAASAAHLAKWRSKIYMDRFLKSLKSKMHKKSANMPDKIGLKGISKIKNFLEFDEKYTAPIHGFKNAYEYWRLNSSIFFIENIRLPTLIVIAKNDPFLTPACYPIKEVQYNNNVFLEMPEGGGHCGFYQKSEKGYYWSETRALQYLQKA